MRPILSQNAFWEVFNLAKRYGFESACPFKPKVKAAYAGEKRQNLKLLSHVSLTF